MLMNDREPSPAEGAQRCGRCERKLVVAYLRGMMDGMNDVRAPGSVGDKVVSSKVLLFVAESIEKGVHEHGISRLEECSKCDGKEED